MKFRDFSAEYPNDPERGMREALNYLVATAPMAAKHLAAELDLSPEEFSRMRAVFPSEDSHHRRSLPLGKAVLLQRLAADYSLLATMLGYLGFDAGRLDGIWKDQAMILGQLRVSIEQVNRIATQLGMLGMPDAPKGKQR